MKMKMNKKNIKTIILIISSFFIGCVVGMILHHPKNETEEEIIKKAIKKVDGSVVSIEGYNGSVAQSSGSGFIYKIEGKKAYILTNAHVVDEAKIMVTNSKEEMVEGTVLGSNELLDIAVVEIDKKYAPMKVSFGDSSKVEIGDTIFTMGSPVSKKYNGSVTKGIISGVNRDVPVNLEDSSDWLLKGIQFDAALNPGSSGGPLFNKKGEVIGICTMKLMQEGMEGMSFAIPIEQAINHLEELESGKELEIPKLGIGMVDTNNIYQLENYDIEIPSKKGVVVVEVKENTSAYKKLEKGDLIIQIDNDSIEEVSDVKYVLSNHKVGDKIKVKIIRNNKEKIITIVLK